jgi:hypothetical protein
VYIVGVFSAWSTNGITINFTVVNGVEYDVSVELIKGCTNIRVDSAVLSTTGVNDITTVGFKPNYGRLMTVGSGTLVAGAHAILGFGAFHNSSTDVVSQGYTAFSSVDNGPSEVATTVTRNDSAIGQLFNDAQSWKGSIQDVDASGFSVNTGADSPGGDYIFYIVADTGDTDGVDVSIVDSPTATGTWSVTSHGFTSQSAMMGISGSSTINTPQTADPTCFGLSMFDGSAQYCVALDVDDAAGTTDTQSNSSTTNAVQLYNGSGGHSLLTEGSFTAFTATGYNFSFPTTVDSTTRKWLSIAVKSTVTGTTITPTKSSVAVSGQAVTLTNPVTLTPTKSTVAMTGQAVLVSEGFTSSPGKSTVTTTGGTVDLIVDVVISPTAGAITVAGQTVLITELKILFPTTATISINGQSVVVDAVFVTTDDGRLVFKLVGSLIDDLIDLLI